MRNLRRIIRKELLKEQGNIGFVTVSSDRKTVDVKCPEGMGVVKIDNTAVPNNGNTWAGGFGGSVQIYCGPVGNEAGDTKPGVLVEPIEGCMDPTAFNYDPTATVDDGSCVPVIYGCTDPTACNYNSLANTDNGSCLTVYGCLDPTAFNYNPLAQCDDGSCIEDPIFGCTDPMALNYTPLANTDDGNCIYEYTDPRSGA